MEREKLWVGVWMRENERGGGGGGNSWRMREKECGNNKILNFFEFQIMRESFIRSTKIREEREFFNP